MQPLYLTAERVRAVLPLSGWLKAADRAFEVLSSNAATTPTRLIAALPPGYLALMPGAVHDAETFGAKVLTLLPGNPAKGLPAIQGLVILFDSKTGAVLALLDGAEVTLLRTAAASASATRALARPNASTLGVLGTGPQALAHIRAILDARPIREVRLWGRSIERAEALAAAVGGTATVEVVTSAKAAAEAEVVCAVTAASAPVIEGAWLQPGAHVNLVGAHTPATRELDSVGVARAKVFVDCLPACLVEAGDLLIPIKEGAITQDSIKGEVGEVRLGRIPGRTSDADITLFKSVGHAVEDLVAAEAVLTAARGG